MTTHTDTAPATAANALPDPAAVAASTADPLIRAYRFALDPTSAQLAHFARHAGAARWAFNHALGQKVEVHHAWRAAAPSAI